MKFSRILGVVAAVLVTTAVAQQATPAKPAAPAPAPAAPEPAAAQPAVPVAPPSAPAQTANTPSTATIVAAPDAQPAAAVPLPEEKPATWGDAKAGQTKAGACAACHGIDGNSGDPQYPKIAGQHETYLARQLMLFKSGERVNPIMQGMAAPLTAQDMRDIGAFYATQKPKAGVADDTPAGAGPNQGVPFYQVGERLYRGGKRATGTPACTACHGPTGRGIPGPTYPSVGGQHAGYAATQLKFFRDGGAWGAGANANTIMAQVAKDLTDEEIQGLATYLEGLHPASAPTPKVAK